MNDVQAPTVSPQHGGCGRPKLFSTLAALAAVPVGTALRKRMGGRHDLARATSPRDTAKGGASYKDAPTKSVTVRGARFSYRQLGPDTGVPVIFLSHLGGNLDNWDPRVVDGIAARRPVITFDNRGVGASEGTAPDSIEAMARDAIAFVRALGFKKVDLLGFSLGGFVSQAIATQEPALVRKIILAGTGPAGGPGIADVTSVTYRDALKAFATFSDPKEHMFFTRTPSGKSAARAFVLRLKERTDHRDRAVAFSTVRTQMKAVKAWGSEKPADLSLMKQPVLVADGESDHMVPTGNSYDLARRLPNATLQIYPDAGHGGIFQFHEQFVEEALEFLDPERK